MKDIYTLPETVPYRGLPFEWGDQTVIIPPLPVKILESMHDVLKETEKPTNDAWERLHQQCVVIIPAIKRNYPNMPDEAIGDLITLENGAKMFAAAVGWTGPETKVRTQGEAVAVLAERESREIRERRVVAMEIDDERARKLAEAVEGDKNPPKIRLATGTD